MNLEETSLILYYGYPLFVWKKLNPAKAQKAITYFWVDSRTVDVSNTKQEYRALSREIEEERNLLRISIWKYLYTDLKYLYLLGCNTLLSI
jgi:hypothetical protein